LAHSGAAVPTGPRGGRHDRLPLGFRSRLPVGFQVFLGVGGLLVLLMASIALAVLLVEGLKHGERRLADRDVPYAAAVAAAALNAKGIANDERGYFISGDRRFIGELDSRVRNARDAFALAERTATGDRQLVAVREARAGFERWVATVRREFAAFTAGERHEAVRRSLGPDRALRKSYEASLARAQRLGATAIDSGRSSVDAASSRSVTILLVCLLLGLVLGCGLALWVVRTILRPVYAVLQLMRLGQASPQRIDE
jgi:CHASE3 domain sensor protein